VRPLIHEDGKSASEISRKDEIFESETGLLSIAGGKLTGYRKMAEKVLDKLMKRLHEEHDVPFVNTKTEHIDLDGGAFADAKEVKVYRKEIRTQLEGIGLEKYFAHYLVSNYGRATDKIVEGMSDFKNENPEHRLIRSELKYCIEHEMVFSIQDFFIRRTGRLYFDISSVRNTFDLILSDFETYFSWSTEKTKAERLAMEVAIKEVSVFQ
jgi:glycerol-3-phosphate dehydrogenase